MSSLVQYADESALPGTSGKETRPLYQANCQLIGILKLVLKGWCHESLMSFISLDQH
jgi:hypothetical protein